MESMFSWHALNMDVCIYRAREAALQKDKELLEEQLKHASSEVQVYTCIHSHIHTHGAKISKYVQPI
jgi:hypothetical protein